MDFPSYHLWLLPSAPLTAAFDADIARFSVRLGGPRFVPHVTLASPLPAPGPDEGASLAAKTRELAKAQTALSVPVLGLRAGRSHFQSVFLALETTPALAHARSSALEAFGLAETRFSPHLSLAYGGPVPERERLVRAEASRGATHCTLDRLALVQASSEDPQDWRVEQVALLGTGPERSGETPARPI